MSKTTSKNITKNIEIQSRYSEYSTCCVRVEPIKINDEFELATMGAEYYAYLTKGQLAKIKRELPNGAKNVNVTKQDNQGRDIEGEVYFNL